MTDLKLWFLHTYLNETKKKRKKREIHVYCFAQKMSMPYIVFSIYFIHHHCRQSNVYAYLLFTGQTIKQNTDKCLLRFRWSHKKRKIKLILNIYAHYYYICQCTQMNNFHNDKIPKILANNEKNETNCNVFIQKPVVTLSECFLFSPLVS